MRKIIASASLAALGAASVHAAYAPGLSPLEQSKPWSIGLAVKGFYDDNYTTSPDALARDSWGFAVNPYIGVNKVMDQTLITLSYNYELRWFDDRESNEADHYHNARLHLNHTFNERYDVQVTDHFIYATESLVELGPVTTPTVLRTDGDYWRNLARAAFNADLTEQAGLMVAYENQYWDFEQKGTDSRSALLDRSEHYFTLEGSWNFRPDTAGLLGYQYVMINMLSGDQISVPAPPPAPAGSTVLADASVRDSRGHRIYLGGEHKVSAKVDVSARVGAQFTDYPDADEDNTTPYGDVRGTWTYNPGSYLQVGIVHTLNQTDVVALDQESTAVWLLLSHRITPKLTGGLVGQWQLSEFNEGFYDGEDDTYLVFGANLSYKLNENLALEASYNFDKLDSDIADRSYDRNRVFFGVRATY